MARAAGKPKSEVAKLEIEHAADAVEPAEEPAPVQAASTESHGRLAEAADLVPGWLALLVLVLLLGVAGLGGYLIRGALIKPQRVTPTEYAVENLENQVKEDPNDPESVLALGYAYQQAGRYEEALEQYEAVLATDPTNNGALYNKGVVLLQMGKTKEGEAALWDLLEVAPDHVLGAKALGEYYVSKKHYKSALVALEPVIKQQPQYADLQYLAGYSCEQLGLASSAITYYQGALTYDPEMAEAKDGLARLGAAQ